MGRKSSENRKVYVKELDEVYDNYRLAAKETNSNRGDVYLCVMGYRKMHNGYHFEFVDELDLELEE